MFHRTSPGDIDVSVVVPAFNEALRLPLSLPLLVPALSSFESRCEIILVDDGSTDDTVGVAARLLSDYPDVRIVQLPWNCGKGAAVRAGVSAARGDAIVFLDADLASDITDLPRLVALLDDADIALGSRTADGAVVTGRTRVRYVAAATYRRLIKNLTTSTVIDTQCGFKAFRAPVAKLLFSMTTATGFGFDVEILTLGAALGFRLVECPVRWTAVEGSHISLRRHGPGMLQDLRRARRHQIRARSVQRLLSPEHALGAVSAHWGGPFVRYVTANVGTDRSTVDLREGGVRAEADVLR